MIEKDFLDQDTYRSKYQVAVDKEMVWVKFRQLPVDFKGDWEKNLYHFCMDIRNIPELIKGIMQVFYGEYGVMADYEFKSYDDDIWLSCNFERVSPSDLNIVNHRKDIAFEDQYLDFYFNHHEIPTQPVNARIPTPAMVWVTDTLKQIYDDWKNQQSGGQGAKV